MTLDDLERQNRGFYKKNFSRYRAAQVYIIHKEAPPSPTPHAQIYTFYPKGIYLWPHAPMADVYYGPDGPSPNDMRFSKLTTELEML